MPGFIHSILWDDNLVDKERSQNAENVTHIKGRLPDQAVILFNCVPFQNGNFSKRKEFAPRGSEFFPLRAVPCGMENYFYHSRWPLLDVTFFTHVRNCLTGATLMATIRTV